MVPARASYWPIYRKGIHIENMEKFSWQVKPDRHTWRTRRRNVSKGFLKILPNVYLSFSRYLAFCVFPRFFLYCLLYGELRTANLAQKQEKPRKNNISQDISRMRGIHPTKIWEQSRGSLFHTKQPAVWSTLHFLFNVPKTFFQGNLSSVWMHLL